MEAKIAFIMGLFVMGMIALAFFSVAATFLIQSHRCDLTIETKMICKDGQCCDYFVVTSPMKYVIPKGFDCYDYVNPPSGFEQNE